MIYRIKDWDLLYENHESRKIKNLQYVLIPNKHDGAGFRRLCKQKDQCELFTAWILIIELASKSPKRGYLINRENLPLSPADMGDKTGFPESIFKKALEFLSSQEIAWIECVDNNLQLFLKENLPQSRENLPPSAEISALNRIELNRTEEDPAESVKAQLQPSINNNSNTKPRQKKERVVADPALSRQISDLFLKGYKHYKQADYIFAGAKDGKALKALAAMNLPIERYIEAIDNGFKDTFHFKNMDLVWLASYFNKLQGAQPQKPKTQEQIIADAI